MDNIDLVVPTIPRKLNRRFFGSGWACLMIFLAYTGIAVVLNFPLVQHITTHTFTNYKHGDDKYFIWLIDWIKTAVFDHQHALWQTNVLYFPSGVDLRMGIDGYLNVFIAAAIDWLVGNPVLAYNIVMLGSLTISAYCAFLLANHLLHHKFAAFIAGCAFGFTSFLSIRTQGHLNLVGVEVLPLVALCFIILQQTGKWRWVFAATISIVLAGLSSNYFLLSSLLLVGLIFIWIIFTSPRAIRKDRINKVLTAVGLGMLLYVACIWPVVQAYRQSPRFIIPENMAIMGSLDPTSFFLPPFWQFFGGPQLFALSQRAYLSYESLAFVGWIELLLLGIGLIRWHHIRRGSADANILYFWSSVVILSIWLALGPFLHIFGTVLRVPLPFYFLRQLPILVTISSPARFVVLALLGLAILLGLIIKRWFERPSNSHKYVLIVGTLLTVLMIGERWISPYALSDNRPTAASRYLSQAPEQGAVLDIPIHIDGFSDYTLSQYHHGRPIVSAYMSRYTQTPRRDEFILATPELLEFTCFLSPENPSVRRASKDFAQFLAQHGISHIVIHKNLPCMGVDQQKFLDYLGKSQPVYEDSATIIFQVVDLL